MRRGVLVVACVVGMLCVAPMGGAAAAPAAGVAGAVGAAGAAAVIGDPLVDFNGDGFADLAVGVSDEDANGGASDTGGVSVIYGSAGGLSATATPDQFWGQDTTSRGRRRSQRLLRRGVGGSLLVRYLSPLALDRRLHSG